MFTGEAISAAEAERWGWSTRWSRRANLESETLGWAWSLAERAPDVALGKESLRNGCPSLSAAGGRRRINKVENAGSLTRKKEGIWAFLEGSRWRSQAVDQLM